MKRTITRKEYHENGELSYVETIRYISKEEYDTGKYNCREDDNGRLWIRVGENAKFFDNKVRNWGMVYNDYGNIVRVYQPMRKDGSYIIY